ncbi:MAG: response regulator transcription factor [Pirellulaceae bacterium]
MSGQQIVYVVDDDAGARDSISCLVRSAGCQVEQYASAEEFIEAFSPEHSGCLVTDLRLRGMSGVALQEKLLAREIVLPTIIVTAYADTPMTVRAMRNGAVIVLDKPCRDQDLWDAIMEAFERDRQWREQRAKRCEIQERLAYLKQSERDVLDLMIAGVANKVIASRLNVSIRTVEVRRQNVYQKMRANSLAELVRLVLEAGKPDAHAPT